MRINILRKITVCAILLIAHTVSLAQVNLVSNPSFENLSSCPDDFAQISRATGWDTLLAGGGGTPDFYHTCCTNPIHCGVPMNFFNLSFQYPKSGVSYAGIGVLYLFFPNKQREYIQTQLNKKLTQNQFYCVKFYASLVDDPMKVFITTLGAYLDDGSVSCSIQFGLANGTPQILSTVPLNDTINWMKIEGLILASGDEEYITIGNFFPDSLSGVGYWGAPALYPSYYYIDDISVIPANLLAYAGNDTLIQPGDSVFIGRQPEIGLDEDCIWFVNGVPIDTVAGLWVQPDTTTTYVVQQTICGNVSWDTVTVSVDTGVGVAAIELDKRFKVYPNPNTGSMTLEYMLEKDESGILIINDIAGRSVSEYTLNANNNSIVINDNRLNNGIYYYSIYVNGVMLKTNRIVIIK